MLAFLRAVYASEVVSRDGVRCSQPLPYNIAFVNLVPTMFINEILKEMTENWAGFPNTGYSIV